MPTFYEILAAAAKSDEPVALGIITGVKGSSPQKVGAKALFYADGRIAGTMGGGCLEAEIQDRARLSLVIGKPETFDLVLDHDFGWDDGLICGGRVTGVILPRIHSAAPIWTKLALRARPHTWGITEDFQIAWDTALAATARYRETVNPACALWIAGAGHIAQAVAPLALALDFTVTVFDDRPALANNSKSSPTPASASATGPRSSPSPSPPPPPSASSSPAAIATTPSSSATGSTATSPSSA